MKAKQYNIIRVKRKARGDKNFTYEDYKIKLEKPTSVLTILREIFWEVDSSLGFYDGCGTGKCKGCHLKVNGKVELACTKIILPSQKEILLEPTNMDNVIVNLLTY